LREVVVTIKSSQKEIGGMYLFSTQAGQLYIAEDGNTGEFNSIWQRFTRKEVDASVERFTEQSLRVKVALDVA